MIHVYTYIYIYIYTHIHCLYISLWHDLYSWESSESGARPEPTLVHRGSSAAKNPPAPPRHLPGAKPKPLFIIHTRLYIYTLFILSLCICIYIYIERERHMIYIHIYIYIHTHTCIHICIHMFAFYDRRRVPLRPQGRESVAGLARYIYIYIYIYTHVLHIYIYIYTHVINSRVGRRPSSGSVCVCITFNEIVYSLSLSISLSLYVCMHVCIYIYI